MNTLDEIRARIKTQQENKIQEETPPITYEQYKVWESLKGDVPQTRLVEYEDYSDSIKCPHCGSSYLHHLGVETFHRREDANGYHVELYDEESHGWPMLNIECPDNTTNENTKDNPSERRGGVLILFGCENCHNISKLGIAQHKGQTLMKWNFKL